MKNFCTQGTTVSSKNAAEGSTAIVSPANRSKTPVPSSMSAVPVTPPDPVIENACTRNTDNIRDKPVVQQTSSPLRDQRASSHDRLSDVSIQFFTRSFGWIEIVRRYWWRLRSRGLEGWVSYLDIGSGVRKRKIVNYFFDSRLFPEILPYKKLGTQPECEVKGIYVWEIRKDAERTKKRVFPPSRWCKDFLGIVPCKNWVGNPSKPNENCYGIEYREDAEYVKNTSSLWVTGARIHSSLSVQRLNMQPLNALRKMVAMH